MSAKDKRTQGNIKNKHSQVRSKVLFYEESNLVLHYIFILLTFEWHLHKECRERTKIQSDYL